MVNHLYKCAEKKKTQVSILQHQQNIQHNITFILGCNFSILVSQMFTL